MDRLAAWVSRRPGAIVFGTAALAIAAALWSAWSLQLDADTNSLVGDDQPYMRRYRAFLRDFGDLEYILVVVDPAGNEAEASEATRELVAGLRALPDLRGATGSISSAEQYRLSTWAMTDVELAGLHEARGALPALTAGSGAGGLLKESTDRLERLLAEGAGMERARQRELAAEAFLLARCALGGMPGPRQASPRRFPSDGFRRVPARCGSCS